FDIDGELPRAGLGYVTPRARHLEPGDETGERVRGPAARQHHFEELKPPAPGVRRFKGGGQFATGADPHAVTAEWSGKLGEAPILQVVEPALRLEHAQHLPTHIVEHHYDRVPAVAAAIAEFEPSHLEGAVANQNQRPQPGRDEGAEPGRHAV